MTVIATPTVIAERLGVVDYEAGLAWQRARADVVRAGGAESVALLQHPPIYTLGARGDAAHVLATATWLAEHGAQVVRTDRGGDVTFHGPGQLVVYPILNLRAHGIGPRDYACRLEECVIATAATFGVTTTRVSGRPGVWVRDAKLAAIGVRVRGGVTSHGLALNIATDLEWFDAIVPCGLADAGVTSLARELGARCPSEDEVVATFCEAFAQVFGVALQPGGAC